MIAHLISIEYPDIRYLIHFVKLARKESISNKILKFCTIHIRMNLNQSYVIIFNISLHGHTKCTGWLTRAELDLLLCFCHTHLDYPKVNYLTSFPN